MSLGSNLNNVFFFQVFAGNSDRNTVVFHRLAPPITARFIRLRPTAWRSFVSLRMELYTYRGKTGHIHRVKNKYSLKHSGLKTAGSVRFRYVEMPEEPWVQVGRRNKVRNAYVLSKRHEKVPHSLTQLQHQVEATWPFNSSHQREGKYNKLIFS